MRRFGRRARPKLEALEDRTLLDFSRMVTFPTHDGPNRLAVADGNLALATPGGGGSTASVLFGNGTGTFHVRHDIPGTTNPTSIAVGDFFGDGQVSIAVTSQAPTPTVSLLHGNGDGTFAAPVVL